MEIENNLSVADIENMGASQEPIVICLSQEGDIEWALPVIPGSQSFDTEVITMVQGGTSAQSVTELIQTPVVDHIEVIPDFLSTVVSENTEESEKTVNATVLGSDQYTSVFQTDDGQIFYITYALPSKSGITQDSIVTEGETLAETGDQIRQPHTILHVAEDGSPVLLNIGEVVDAVRGDLDSMSLADNDIENAVSLPSNQKTRRSRFPSGRIKHCVVGTNLRIEEKLQVVDAMLPPAPERTRKKKEKDDSNADINEENVSYLCDMCGASFPREAQYFGHLHIHAGERKWVCTLCPGEPDLGSQSSLWQHERSTHIVLRPHACLHCPATFSRPSQLIYHRQRVHTGERPHSCQICNKGFFRRSDLRTHLNIHLGINKSICETCGKKFNHVSNLIRHCRVHTGIKPYPCSVCGRRFSQLNAMHQHKTIHQENRDVACSLCPRMFKSFAVMRQHMRYVHEDKLVSMGKEAYTALKMKEGVQSRRFYCKLCGESFEYAALLRHHETIHEKENNYHCKYCKQDFLNADDLKTHCCDAYDAAAVPKHCNEIIQQDHRKKLQTDVENSDLPSTHSIIMYLTEDGKVEPTEIRIRPVHVVCEQDSEAKVPLILEEQSGSKISPPRDKEIPSLQKIFVYSEKDSVLFYENKNDQKVVNVSEHTDTEGTDSKSCMREKKLNDTESSRCIKNDISKPNNVSEMKLEDSTQGEVGIKVKEVSCKKSVDIQKDEWAGSKSQRRRRRKQVFKSSGRVAGDTIFRDSIDINEMVEYVDEEDENGVKTKKKVYKCPGCPKKFNKNSNFKQHLGTHYMDLMKHSCPSCGQYFAWKSTLNKHMLKMHSDTPQPKCSCEYCGREYPLAVQVQEHIKRDHLKQRPFVCSTCNKTFYKKYDLRVHSRVHTKEKPYICGTCSKSFNHLSHIIRHERIHNGVRPYKCSDCDREFIQSSSLKAHRQRHVIAAERRKLSALNCSQPASDDDLEKIDIPVSADRSPTL